MSLKLGTNNIGKVYAGTEAIGKIYIGTELVYNDAPDPVAIINNSWRAWDASSFTNGGTTCTDVINGLVLGPYASGSPGAFFYGSYNNVVGDKYWQLNGAGSHGRRAGFTRPTEFSVSYWGNKTNTTPFNSERAIWSFNIFGANSIRLARKNISNQQYFTIYSGNSSIATFSDSTSNNSWYNITTTFSVDTVKTYVGLSGNSSSTLIDTTVLTSGNISNAGNGTGFWIGTNSGYTDWLTDKWSSLSIYDGVAGPTQINTIVSNGYQQ